jgi:hypothetical protein
MRTTNRILICSLLVVWLAGCHTMHYSATDPTTGAKTEYRSTGLLANQALKGLRVNTSTKATKTGLGLTTATTEIDNEALGAMLKAVGEVLIKGASP